MNVNRLELASSGANLVLGILDSALFLYDASFAQSIIRTAGDKVMMTLLGNDPSYNSVQKIMYVDGI